MKLGKGQGENILFHQIHCHVQLKKTFNRKNWKMMDKEMSCKRHGKVNVLKQKYAFIILRSK